MLVDEQNPGASLREDLQVRNGSRVHIPPEAMNQS